MTDSFAVLQPLLFAIQPCETMRLRVTPSINLLFGAQLAPDSCHWLIHPPTLGGSSQESHTRLNATCRKKTPLLSIVWILGCVILGHGNAGLIWEHCWHTWSIVFPECLMVMEKAWIARWVFVFSWNSAEVVCSWLPYHSEFVAQLCVLVPKHCLEGKHNMSYYCSAIMGLKSKIQRSFSVALSAIQ